MPYIHDKQSAKEMIAVIHFWTDVFKKIGAWLKKITIRVFSLLRKKEDQIND